MFVFAGIGIKWRACRKPEKGCDWNYWKFSEWANLNKTQVPDLEQLLQLKQLFSKT